MLFVAVIATALALASLWQTKKARGLSVLAIALALAPSLFLGAKFIENQYYESSTNHWLAGEAPGTAFAQPAVAPAFALDNETGAVVVLPEALTYPEPRRPGL